jgi:hypothetical protein
MLLLNRQAIETKDKELKFFVGVGFSAIGTVIFNKISGDIASRFGANGGGMQYELQMPVEWLEKLGLLREIQ